MVKSVRHGLKNTTEYNSWCGMKQRCNYKKHRSYPRYGGRGIKVCDRWNKNFLAFLQDMGHKPSSVHSLERIDNDGDYEPGNCRWATLFEQGQNRADVHRVEYRGQTKSVREWSLSLGISYGTLRQRLFIYKWPTEKAFNNKVREYNKEQQC